MKKKTFLKLMWTFNACVALVLIGLMFADNASATEVERDYRCNNGVVVQDLVGGQRVIYPASVRTSTYNCIMTSPQHPRGVSASLYIKAKQEIVSRFSAPIDRSVAAENRVIKLTGEELGQKFVMAKINGLALKLMLDSGCSDIAIKKSAFRRISKRPEKVENSYAETAGGQIPIEVFSVDVDVQGVKLRGLKMAVLPGMSDPQMDGLIGMSFLGQFDSFSVDHRNNTLTLGNRRVGR